MKLTWEQDADNAKKRTAETIRHRFIMLEHKRGRVELWVQHSKDDWVLTRPIDRRYCVSKRSAERIAQRFEDAPVTPRRLR